MKYSPDPGETKTVVRYIYIYVYNIKYDVKEIYKPNSSSGDRLAQSVERLHKWDGRGFDPRRLHHF